MNIFHLDDPYQFESNCRYYVDSHVVKMRLETCQMLACNMHFMHGVTKRALMTDDYVEKVWSDFPRRHPDGSTFPYGIGYHRYHPCTKWSRETASNFRWLTQLGLSLCAEHEFRFGLKREDQACYHILQWFQAQDAPTQLLPDSGLTVAPQTICACCRTFGADYFNRKSEVTWEDTVAAYRRYYNHRKTHLFSWSKVDKPDWINDDYDPVEYTQSEGYVEVPEEQLSA